VNEKGEGRPHQQLTSDNSSNQHSRSWYDRPHDELVGAFREYLASQRKKYGRHADLFPPENIIHATLWREQAGGDQRREFFQPLTYAWDAIAFECYEPGSSPENRAADLLHFYEEPTVQLPDPLQVRILDALAEAAGIPHEKGQAVIPIPEKLLGRNYTNWLLSPERERAVAQARAKRRELAVKERSGLPRAGEVPYRRL
jgi:hypothetical protein